MLFFLAKSHVSVPFSWPFFCRIEWNLLFFLMQYGFGMSLVWCGMIMVACVPLNFMLAPYFHRMLITDRVEIEWVMLHYKESFPNNPRWSLPTKGLCKVNKNSNNPKKIWIELNPPTHPLSNFFFFGNPSVTRPEHSNRIYRQNTSHYAQTTWVLNPYTGNYITTTIYTGANSIALVSEMHHLVNRTAIQLLSQNHRIRDKMLHACAPWGATCTAKQGRIVQTQNFIFGQFSNFFYPNGTWTHPPTSKLFLEFF